MSVHAKIRSLSPLHAPREVMGVAAAYDHAGDDYLSYADGDPGQLYSFEGHYGYGDSCIWNLIDARLCELRADGATSIRILDAGCGPGTWLRRVVTRALDLGFDTIEARGFDVADAQLDLARGHSRQLAQAPGVTLRFEVGDLTRPLPEAIASVDLCLCLYGVLNHLPKARLPDVMAEFARVTRGCFIASVRSAGSTPSIFVDSIDHARSFHQDNVADRCDVELQDGRRVVLSMHLFTAAELRALVSRSFEIDDLRGLDLFHGRFSPDPRWNPPSLATDQVERELQRLEEAYARTPGFIDRAIHLLLAARPARR